MILDAKKACENCVFSEEPETNEKDPTRSARVMRCHRYAPRPSGSDFVRFPLVSRASWCGEHQYRLGTEFAVNDETDLGRLMRHGHVFDDSGECSCGHTTRDDPKRCPNAPRVGYDDG